MECKNKKNTQMPIRYLKGVGPKKAAVLSNLGINTIEDILFYLPRRYEDRSKFALIREVKIGEYHTIRAKVLSLGIYTTKRQIPVFQLTIGDSTGVLYCVWFNMPFLKKNFKVGQTIIVYGKVERYSKIQMNHPDYEIMEKEPDSIHMGRIVPIYSLKQDISQRYLRLLTYGAVMGYVPLLRETLPTYIRAKRKLVDIHFAVRSMHFPHSFKNLEKSYHRLVFEEFFLLQVALAKKKFGLKEKEEGIKHSLDEDSLVTFKKLLPFELTDGQLKAITEVERDMASEKPMNRLLEGDVGSGKTVVALYALLVTVKNGNQGVIMAPTEILARQHYMTMSELLMPLGINIRLLISGIPKDKKQQIKEEIKNGDVDVVCGTHALIQEDVLYNKLGLIVIDEQHKFGVTQRALIKDKGDNPDLLVMTATPIPRTLALTVYGDLDISVIKQMPHNRRPITTFWVEEERRQTVYEFVRQEVRKGRQVYIVYPRVSKTAGSNLKAVTSMYNKIQDEIFPDLQVGIIHGKMSSAAKEAVMKKFKDGVYGILVSSVIVEIGIDIPNASVMIIENAERFGLSQLHQLRGRIGRGDYDSYCILLGTPTTDSAERRLSKIVETQDGFEIAEEDLELRGPGEFFGTRQHGLPELKFGNLTEDFEIMEEARKEAFKVVSEDTDLKDPKNAVIRWNLEKRFGVAPVIARSDREAKPKREQRSNP